MTQKTTPQKPAVKFGDIVKAKINTVDFPESQYFREMRKKNQIVLHHTASGKGSNGDYNTWLRDKTRIATCIIIDYTGEITQLFGSSFWGYHLGVTNQQIMNLLGSIKQNSTDLNANSIAIEVDCWGYLQKIDGEYRAYPNDFGRKGPKTVIPLENIQFYEKPFKGYTAFEKYTAAQIQTTKELLIYWHLTHGISLKYNEDIWDLTKRAMSGENGVFTHNSYRKDKSDIHPQPEMIAMLKKLSQQYS